MRKKLDLVYGLIGKEVIFKRIAGNSIILFFDGKPGDPNVQTLWLEPLWRYEKQDKYILGSQDFPSHRRRNQTDNEFNNQFGRFCKRTNPLINTKVLDIKINNITNDIFIKFEKNQTLQTFAVFRDDANWYYGNTPKKIRITGCIDRIDLDRIKSKN